MNLKELQEVQAQYDSKYWNQFEGMADVRHVLLHLIKLTGKLAVAVESDEHEATEFFTDALSEPTAKAICADLLIYALHLSNRLGYDLEDLYNERIEGNKAKFDK